MGTRAVLRRLHCGNRALCAGIHPHAWGRIRVRTCIRHGRCASRARAFRGPPCLRAALKRRCANVLAAGLAIGSATVLVGATAGAVLAFMLARYVLRDAVATWARGHASFAALDKVMSSQGLKIVLLLRLSPIIPFNAFNYVAGLTGVSMTAFTLGSVGMVPGTVAFVCVRVRVHDDALAGASALVQLWG